MWMRNLKKKLFKKILNLKIEKNRKNKKNKKQNY
jgi:hypothetical protein